MVLHTFHKIDSLGLYDGGILARGTAFVSDANVGNAFGSKNDDTSLQPLMSQKPI